MNSKKACKYIRQRRYDGGILMLTAKDANEDIEMAVLRARVRALLRGKNKIVEEEICVGALTLNKDKRSVFIDYVWNLEDE